MHACSAFIIVVIVTKFKLNATHKEQNLQRYNYRSLSAAIDVISTTVVRIASAFKDRDQ